MISYINISIDTDFKDKILQEIEDWNIKNTPEKTDLSKETRKALKHYFENIFNK